MIDAKSVFDNVTNVDLRIPSEQSLVVVLLALREVLKKGVLTRLWWCDTEDMVSDALTKGAVSREQIIALFRLGQWILKKATKRGQLRDDNKVGSLWTSF